MADKLFILILQTLFSLNSKRNKEMSPASAGAFLYAKIRTMKCNFPLKFLSVYEVRRPSVVEDKDRETVSLDYGNVTAHTINAFLHEVTDDITAGEGHTRQEEKRAILTTHTGADILRGDLIVNGADLWLVDKTPNDETSPFTAWQPTLDVRCVAWQG